MAYVLVDKLIKYCWSDPTFGYNSFPDWGASSSVRTHFTWLAIISGGCSSKKGKAWLPIKEGLRYDDGVINVTWNMG